MRVSMDGWSIGRRRANQGQAADEHINASLTRREPDKGVASADLEQQDASPGYPLVVATQALHLMNEKLRFTEESVMAAAEELQCTCQELRAVTLTLQAVNAELKDKRCRLDEAVADLDQLSRVSGEPRVYLDAQLRLIRVSTETSALFRFHARDVGRRIMDFNHQLDYPELGSDLLAVLNSRTPCHREVGDKIGRCWLVTLQPMTLPGPDKPSIVMICVDVSSQRHLLQLQRVVDSMAGNVAVLDPEGGIKLVNRAWREAHELAECRGTFGLSARAAGDNYLDACRSDTFLDDNDTLHLVTGLNAVLAGRQQAFTCVYACSATDAPRWLLMHAAPMVDGYCVVTHINLGHGARPARSDGVFSGQGEALPGGSLVWLEASKAALIAPNSERPLSRRVVERVTESMTAREAVEHHRHELAERAASHATELTQARDVSDLTELNKRLFLTHMSHELRTPIKDILDRAQIAAARLTLEEANFSPMQLIDDTLQIKGPSARAKGLQLFRTTQSMPDLVYGDAFRLRQVLLHFVGNAIKFSERGAITVCARVVEHDGDGVLLRLEVMDHGIGLSSEQQQRLVQSIAPVDNAPTRKFGGPGLGLAIAKRLTNLMGGDVGVISVMGMGSTFWATARLRFSQGGGKATIHAA